MIEVKNLSKTYYQGDATIPILQNIQFTLKESQTLAVVGHSGCGKTTLLSLIAGLEKPDQGTIHINGQDITRMSEKQLVSYRAHNMGIVFQQFHLMPHLTALENVSLPLEIIKKSNSIKKAKEQIEQIQLSHRLHHLPYQLSGGEQQRIAIARAMVHQPKILLADEPTGNLDHHSAKTTIDLLFSLVKTHRTTLILVTHNQKLSDLCSQQIHLNQR